MYNAPYGYCPKCGAEGVIRERKPDGNTTCSNDHIYLSRDALPENFRPVAYMSDVEMDARIDAKRAAPLTPHGEQQFRIEALRAATRVVAGTFTRVMDGIPADDRNITSTTLIVAKQFAKYLETGE